MAPGDAGDAMALGEAVIVAGIGCRKGATVDEVEAAIEAALKAAGCAPQALSLIATSDGKGGEPGIVAFHFPVQVRPVQFGHPNVAQDQVVGPLAQPV